MMYSWILWSSFWNQGVKETDIKQDMKSVILLNKTSVTEIQDREMSLKFT